MHRTHRCYRLYQCLRCACSTTVRHLNVESNCIVYGISTEYLHTDELSVLSFDMYLWVHCYNTHKPQTKNEAYVRHFWSAPIVRQRYATYIHRIHCLHFDWYVKKRRHYANDAHHTIAFFLSFSSFCIAKIKASTSHSSLEWEQKKEKTARNQNL